MCVGLHVKCPLLLSDFNQNWNVLGNCDYTVQYLENPFSGSRVVACGQTFMVKIIDCAFLQLQLQTSVKRM
jgi:hypothetical protein